MTNITWKDHHQNDLEDVKYVQQKMKDEDVRHDGITMGIEARRQRELRDAKTEPEKDAVNAKAVGELRGEIARHDKQVANDEKDLHKMEDKLAANKNLHAVDPDKPPPGQPTAYEKHSDIGLDPYSNKSMAPANDNKPGGPGGSGSSGPGNGPNGPDGPAAGPGGSGGSKKEAAPDPERDFSAAPPARAPQTSAPSSSLEEEQSRSR